MAEHPEEAEAASEQASEQQQTKADAVALALGRTRRGSKSLDAQAETFLAKQSRLIDLQTEHLHEQRELQTSRLRWGRFNDRIKAALQLMTVMVGLAVVAVVGVMAWQAHEDHGVVVAPFSVPPDLAQRGLTGRVVASQLLDKLLDMQSRTYSSRAASTYKNNWGGEIKVEIPETGVSFGELNAYLREWLGRETRITGELVRTPMGLAITARAGEEAGKTFPGTDAELERMVQQAAETIYSQTQPYRYAAYLSSVGRTQEAQTAFAQLAQAGPEEERGWAYVALATASYWSGDFDKAVRNARTASALNPRLEQGCALLAASEFWSGGLGHDEDAYQQWIKCIALLRSGRGIDVPARDLPETLRYTREAMERAIGDYPAAIADSIVNQAPIEGSASYPTIPFLVHALAVNHDVSGSRKAMANPDNAPRAEFPLSPTFAKVTQAEALEDWPSVVAELQSELPRQQAQGAVAREPIARMLLPRLAYGYARTGRQAEAEALIAGTPLDCDPCVLTRARIAAAKGDRAGADRWFGVVAGRSPSIPFANTAWGEALLARGERDRAVARLAEAHKQSPHFADPIELWGEALMKGGDDAGAVGKFREADQYAPRWGRNHLRWGQALAKLGKAEEARSQFQAAAGMDLSATDRAELVAVTRARSAPASRP